MGWQSGDELIDPCSAPRRARGTHLRRPCTGRRGATFQRPGHAPAASLPRWVRRSPKRPPRHRDWRSGNARSLRSPAAQQAFEAMLPALLSAVAAGADPEHALNRLQRHRRAAVERREPVPPARCAAAARGAAGASSSRMRPRSPISWPAARTVRRPVRRVEFRDAAGAAEFAGASATRCAAIPTTWRSTVYADWSTNGASRSAFS